MDTDGLYEADTSAPTTGPGLLTEVRSALELGYRHEADAIQHVELLVAEVERLRAKLAEVEAERDRLAKALARWGRWFNSLDIIESDALSDDLFDAAVEGLPADCFSTEVSDAG